MNIRLTLINKLEISTSGLLITVLLTWVSLGTLSLTVYVPSLCIFISGRTIQDKGNCRPAEEALSLWWF